MTTPYMMHLVDLEGAKEDAFHSSWLSGGMTPVELMDHFMSLPIDLHPMTCLVQSSGTGKSRLIYETALRSPSLYAALASSRYGTFPPPAKFASSILSVRNSDDVIHLLTEWTNLMTIQFSSSLPNHKLEHWFEYQMTSITPSSLPLPHSSADAIDNRNNQKNNQSTLGKMRRQLETNILKLTADVEHQRLFLFLDEAHSILDDPELRLYTILRKGLHEFNRAAQCGSSILCVLVSDSLPPSMILRRQLRSEFPDLHSDTIHAAVAPIYALGVQGEPQVVHPSHDIAQFCSTTASMRRFGRPAWRIGIDDDTIFTLYSQRMALTRGKINSALFHRILVSLTTNVAYRNHDEIAVQLLRHGWGQLMEVDSLRRGDAVVTYSSEPFLASVALSFLRHNTEVAAIMDVLATDAQKQLWDVEQRHCLIARLSVLRALSGSKGTLMPFSEFTRALWGRMGCLEAVLPQRVQDYRINLNHFIKPDTAHLVRISLSSFFQRCAGWIVSSQYHHFDFAIPLWTGGDDETLDESRMSAAFVSVIHGVRGQRPGAQFWSFFKTLNDNRVRAAKTPVLELARKVAKPAIYLVLDGGCQEPRILDTGANLCPLRSFQQKVNVTSSHKPHPPLPQRSDSSLHRRLSPAALSDADTRCTSEARTSFDHGHYDFDSSDLDLSRKPSISRQPLTADWLVIHAPLYPGVYRSALWLRAAALTTDPSVSRAVVPLSNCPRATSLFYHQAMSTTPTSLLVDQ